MSHIYDRVLRGTVVTVDGELPAGWIAVDAGRIAAIGSGELPKARDFEDHGDAWIFPGFIDGQVHACSYSGYAGIESTTRAAIAGGITTIVDMPYDLPKPLNDLETLQAKVEVIDKTAYADVVLYGTVAPGQGTGEIAALAKAGIAAFKLSAFESNPTRFPRISTGDMLEILTAASETGLPVGLHNEDQEIVLKTIAEFRQAGWNGPEYHSASRPPAAELASTAQFLELGAATGAHVHLVHISTPRGYQLVENYRRDGFKATAEMCVHYLHFDAKRDIKRLGAILKVNPPIREGVTEALWEEMEKGDITFTSSDHSSWPSDNKFTPSIFDAGAGIPGLETLARSFFTDLLERDDTSAVAVVYQQLCEGPARFFGVWPRKGSMSIGADADFAVVRRKQGTFRAVNNHDGLNWSPYDGETFEVAITATYLRGRQVWDGTEIVGAPGDGKYVPRTGPSIFATAGN